MGRVFKRDCPYRSILRDLEYNTRWKMVLNINLLTLEFIIEMKPWWGWVTPVLGTRYVTAISEMSVLSLGLGLTIPLGSTEENPYLLGAESKEHQHFQFGTGVLSPRFQIAWNIRKNRFGPQTWASAQTPIYKNRKDLNLDFQRMGDFTTGQNSSTDRPLLTVRRCPPRQRDLERSTSPVFWKALVTYGSDGRDHTQTGCVALRSRLSTCLATISFRQHRRPDTGTLCWHIGYLMGTRQTLVGVNESVA